MPAESFSAIVSFSSCMTLIYEFREITNSAGQMRKTGSSFSSSSAATCPTLDFENLRLLRERTHVRVMSIFGYRP